jgi:hypothetical protein
VIGQSLRTIKMSKNHDGGIPPLFVKKISYYLCTRQPFLDAKLQRTRLGRGIRSSIKI